MALTSSSLPSLLYFLMVVLAFLGRGSLCQCEQDLVVGLPGQPAVGFRHYAGYVRTRPEDEKALFYWFFEADGGQSSTKPLVLWLNGGPGCSSVAYGAAQELGPFLVRSSSLNLTYNRFSWNKVANLLFLEAPVGVGYSYTNKTSDLRQLGDRVTANDSYAFLLNWFKKFPQFKSNEFYISGESYAGHYVPQLAELIFDGNKGATRDSYINFKGFMIGNAVINEGTDQVGMVEYAWSHAIISDDLYHTITRDCGDFTSTSSNGAASCSSALRSFLGAYQDIDIYSIYTPVCLDSMGTASTSKNSNHSLAGAELFLFSHPELWESGDRRLLRMTRAGYDPCTEDYVISYFNNAAVQRALHANTTGLSYSYSPCRYHIIFLYNISRISHLILFMLMTQQRDREVDGISFNSSSHNPKAHQVRNPHLDLLWFLMAESSGDTDGRVPVTSTRYSLKKMGLKTEKEWRAWYHQKQVAGWVVEYENGLTFATLRGAGHQVPVLAPDRSLSLLSHFLAGEPLPSGRK